MRRYESPTLDELNEYEDESEAEGSPNVEYEVEEPPKPNKEELQYLELRQRLKENFRNKNKKDSTSSHSGFLEIGKKLPYDNFGSFFGPSQPVIAQRVIQESKSLLETQHLTSKRLNSNKSTKTANHSTTISSMNASQDCKPKPKPDELKIKVQNIKEARDYSFLFSDDELPAPSNEFQSQNMDANSVVKPSQASLKGKQSLSHGIDKQFLGNPESRKPVPSKPHKPGMNSITGEKKLNSIPARRPDSVPVNSRKVIQNTENGRSLGTRGVPLKGGASKLERKPAPMPTTRDPSHSKTQSSIPKQQFQPKQTEVSKMSNGSHKPPVNPSKPLVNKSASKPIEHHKKKPTRQYSDDEDDETKLAFSMMRKLTGYNPNKFSGYDDEDDSDMEAGFNDIMMEERRSEKLGRMEDAEELKKIEAEERREMLRKIEKKRKLSQR